MNPVPFLPDDLDGAQLAVEVAWGADLTAAAATWVWSDITEDVRYEDGPIDITLGRSDEASESQPAECSMVLDNASGAYSLGPQSSNYPNVRRNTPVRLQAITGLGLDLPGGTGSSYANTSDTPALDTVDLDVRIELTHNTWRPRASYEVLAAKYLTSGDQRSWAVFLTDTGRLLLTWSHDGTYAGVLTINSATVPADSGRMAVRFTLDVDDGAGGFAYAFYTAPSLDGPWTLLEDGTISSATTTIFPSTADLTVGAGHGGNIIYTSAELLDGVVHGFELRDSIDGPIVANPNFEATRSDYTVSTFTGDDDLIWNISGDARFVDPTRFFGYATGFTPSWNLAGNVPTVSLAANGVLRRLQQRKSPVISALTRYLSTLTTPVAYWSLEEGKTARYAKATIGAHPFEFVQHPDLDPPEGKIKWGAADDNPALLRAPEVSSGGALFANVDPSRLDDSWTITWAQKYAAQTGARNVWRTTDDTFTLSMVGYTNGSIEISLSTAPLESVILMTHQFAPDDYDGVWHYYAMNVRQVGSTVEFYFDIDGVGVDAAAVTDTMAGVRQIEYYSEFDVTEPISIGHVMVLRMDEFLDSVKSDLTDAHAAHLGENAGARLQRLCDEHAVPLVAVGGVSATMGPQFPDTFLALIRECETADQGVLYDGVGPGLAYVSRDRRENARAAAIIDVGAAELAPEFAPVDDDQRNVNQVIAQQREGSSAVYEDTDGPLGTAAIGLYDGDIDVNIEDPARLRDYASWLVHLGTVEGYRYPSVSLNMRSTPHLAGPWQGVGPSARVDLIDTAAALDNHEDISIPLLVEGLEQTISPREWIVTAMSSLYRPWRIIVLAADTGDTDPNLCHLDTSHSELVADVATGGTELLVTSDQVEGFESADLAFDIVDLGAAGWYRTNFEAHSGAWSLRSGNVGDNESSEAIITVPDGVDEMSFWYRVSSEDGFDFFIFKIDGVTQFVSSGEVVWTQSAVYAVRPGQKFTFGYGKDGSASAGSDAAFVDDVTFGHRRWTTLADDFPFQIEVGGTVVNVTDITGTDSQQTFTVDPVPRALVAGAAIEIHDPPVLGL